jgi:hypothetical protein
MSPTISSTVAHRPLTTTSLLLQNYANYQRGDLGFDGNTSLPQAKAGPSLTAVRERIASQLLFKPIGKTAILGSDFEGSERLPSQVEGRGKQDLIGPMGTNDSSSLPASSASPFSDFDFTSSHPGVQSPRQPLCHSPDEASLFTLIHIGRHNDTTSANGFLPVGDLAELTGTLSESTPSSGRTSTPSSGRTIIDSAKQTPQDWTPPSLIILGPSPRYVNDGSDVYPSSPTETESQSAVTIIETESSSAPVGLGIL